MTVHIRAEREADVPTVHNVVGDAFGGDEVPDLLADLRRSVAWLDLSFVAEDEGQVIGHVSYTRAWLDDPDRLVDVLVLSPVSVRPDRHGRGVGSRLVTETLARLRRRPEPLVFLEGGPGFYGRLGFEPGGRWGFTRPSVRIPEAAFQVVRLPAYDEGLRGALVYPDVFWRHDSVGLRP